VNEMTLDVLIAEDEKDAQEMYEHAFSKRNVNVTIRGNLKDAIKEAQGRKFDLYITDGTYPEDGDSPSKRDICYDFYQKIKEINPEAKIVVVSSMNYHVPSEKAPDMTNLSKFDFDYGVDKLLETVKVKNG
jgi:DNA-binding NtrC family response regulator